jgi:hypothetical protein
MDSLVTLQRLGGVDCTESVAWEGFIQGLSDDYQTDPRLFHLGCLLRAV